MKIALEFLKRLGSRDSRDTQRAVTPAPLLMALEPRIVYDASVAAVGTQHHAEADTHVAGTRAIAHARETAIAVERDGGTSSRSATWVRGADQAGRDTGAATATHAVVFVDPSVANYQQLVSGLPKGTAVVVLDANSDGLAQMAQYLQQHQGVESIHLVSHGADGEIQAGSTWLNEVDLASHSAALAQIGAAMKPGGDFLIYGCDVAASVDGKALVQHIASISHLNVAASTDLTGAAALGGDWTLEYTAGAIRTPVILTKAVEQKYGGVLSVYVETYDGNVGFDTGSTPVVSTALDGLIYTGDQAVEYQIVSGSLPYSGAGGEFIVNTQGTQMSMLTIQRQDGSLMAVQSFDIDIFVSNAVTVQALDSSGSVIGSTVLDISTNASSSLFHVDLSHNSAFSQVKSLRLVESSGNGTFLSPTLDNFTYIAPSAPPTLTATGGSTSFVAGDNVTSMPVAIDSGITLTDGNSSTAVSATVSITGNLHTGEDVLAFVNTSASTYGNISATYNASLGTMTLTSAGGTATIAQWQAALRASTYTDTFVTPNTATRTISFSITNDGYTGGNIVTKAVTVADTDQTPIVTTSSGSITYHTGASATTVDSHVTVSDSDNTTQSSGAISISGGFHSGDTLSFTNSSSTTFGNIVGSYNAGTGVLTLTSSSASATDTQWANALSAVTFSSTSTTYGNRTISFATSDGAKTSTAATDIVNVQTPLVITTDSGSAAFVAGDNTTSTPVAIDSGLTVTDSSAATLGSATVGITGNFHAGEDVLSFTNDGATMGNIVASYDASTGVLSLTSAGANATLAQWQSALRSVTYTDTRVTPNSTTRTISFSAVDGGGNASATATRTVTVTDTDQTPIVHTTQATTGYVGGSSAVVIDGVVSVSDLDNSTQSSATASISLGFHSGDTLSFVNDGSTMGDITSSYNSATGVLTFSSFGGATNAQWSSALSSVTFSSTSTTYGNRTISFATNDGTKTSAAATDTVMVTAPPRITTDSGSAAFVAGDNITSTPVAIDSGLTVTDGSAATLGSATVVISGNFHAGEDVLSFTNDGATMGNIVASYNASTGVLTLTSSGANATLAQWQSALRSVTYTDTAVTPNNATRTISFSAVDGAGNASASATRTLTVTDTDQTPIVTTTGGTTNYVGGTSAVIIDGGISVSDLDNTTQSSATVSISAGFHSGDTLTFVNTSSSTFGNIVGSYNSATGVLTLTSSGATASTTQWTHALGAVSFSASSSATPGSRTISFNTSDGTKTSTTATDTVDVLGPPTITTDSGSAAFVAGDNAASTPVTIDSGITLTDGVSGTLASATIAITGNFRAGEDVLGFTNTSSASYGNLTASYNAATGVLTLTSAGASATLAQWQAALRSVTYTDTAVTPNNATRTISFAATDAGAYTSNTATRTVTVTDVDQTPIVTTTGGSTRYVAGTSAVTIDGGISVSDLDDTTQSSATVSISAGFHSGDTLFFINTSSATFGNIVGSYNASTGVMTLTSSGATASTSQWTQALSAVTFSASSSATPGNRTISFNTSDGAKTSATATDTVDVLGPPTITTDSGSAAFVAGDNVASTPVAIDAGLTVTDGAAATLASATVALTGNFHAGEDVLGFVNDGATMGNIVGSYNAATGVLTLSSAGGTATLAQWQSALDSVTYTDTDITPTTATRTVSFTVVDGGGVTSNTATRTVTVTAVDQTPVVVTSGGSTSFVSGDNTVSTPVRIDPGLALSDRDNGTLASATVAITGNFQAGQDVLAFVNDGASMGNIVGSYNAATGTLTLTSAGGAATVAQWQSALDSVTYTDTAVSPNPATRTITFNVSDGTRTSVPALRTVSVTATDQTPIVTTSGGSAAFVAGDNAASTPVVVDGGIALSDRDNAGFASATVAITGHFHAGEDVLAFINTGASMGNITGAYNASTGVLTLTSAGGSATVAQWQAALASVTYTDTAVTPDNATRTISFTVNDGQKNSTAATRTITVADTDQTPVVTTSGGSAAFIAGDNTTSMPVTVDPGIALSDRDNATLVSAAVAITGHFHAGEDVLAFTNDGATMGNIVGTYDASTGVLTLSSVGGTATVAQWQAALASVTYVDTAVTPDNATRTISFSVNDGDKTSMVATRAVTVADTSQTPVVVTSSGSASFGGIGVDKAPVAIDPGIKVSDRDSATLARATVSIVGGFRGGEDVLHFANDGATMGNITGEYDAATGVLHLSSTGGTATVAQWQAALATVSYADTSLTAAAGTRTIAFVVNDGSLDSAVATRTVSVVSGFTGSLIMPTPASTGDITVSSKAGAAMSGLFSPVVLNALADVPLLGLALPPTHTITFAVADMRHHERELVGTTHVPPVEWTLPEPIARPFNVPTTTVRATAAHGERASVALASLLDANARVVAVIQANGQALPEWLHYDAGTGMLQVRGPSHGAAPREVHLLLVMQDQQGHRVYREVVVDLGHGKASPAAASRDAQAAAKPSLSEQLARERRAFHVSHSAPIAHPQDAAAATLASNH
ncbi:sulfurtransferase [Dyella jiangningensis]|nr:sulfurtransferase [Dyella jiangningensis]